MGFDGHGTAAGGFCRGFTRYANQINSKVAGYGGISGRDCKVEDDGLVGEVNRGSQTTSIVLQ